MARSRAPGLTADSDIGRCLLALRAGAMTASELTERFGGKNPAYALVRCGWVANDGEFFTLTEAGRAACPFRNPLAAAAAQPPTVAKLQPEELMVTKTEILDQIKAAGPNGIRRITLAAFFKDSSIAVVDNHISHLYKAGALFKRGKGHLVAAEFSPPGADSAPAAQAPVAANNSASGEAVVVPPAADPAVAEQPREAGAKPAPGVAPSAIRDRGREMLEDLIGPDAFAPSRAEAGPPIVHDITRRAPGPRQPAPSRAEDGSDISFAVWDDGVFTIHKDGLVIDLPPEATRRLVRFVGQMELAE